MADETKKSILDALSEFFSGKDKSKLVTLSSDDITSLEERLKAAFAADLKAKDEKIIALESKFSAQQTGDAVTRRVEVAMSGLKSSNHWVPAFDKMGVPEIFAALAASPSQEITFSDGKVETKLDPVAAFAKFLNGLKKLVPEGVEFSESEQRTVASDVPENAGAVDPGSVAFNGRIEAFAKDNKVTYIEAYNKLRAEGDGPGAGGASAGAV